MGSSAALFGTVIFFIIFAESPIIQCGPIRETREVPTVSSWKECPTYGPFAGQADEDHDCCIREDMCAFNSTDVDWDLNQFVVRTKRAADQFKMVFGNQHKSPKNLWEISLCETRSELRRPLFGTRAETNERVQVLQILPVFVQHAVLDWCLTGPTVLIGGECRQQFKTEEFFTVSGSGDEVAWKREGLLVPSGCSVIVDLSPVRERLQLALSSAQSQQPAPANYYHNGRGPHMDTIPVNSYADLDTHDEAEGLLGNEKESPVYAENYTSSSSSLYHQIVRHVQYQHHDKEHYLQERNSTAGALTVGLGPDSESGQQLSPYSRPQPTSTEREASTLYKGDAGAKADGEHSEFALEFPDTRLNSISYDPTEEPTDPAGLSVPAESSNPSKPYNVQGGPAQLGLPILFRYEQFDPVKNLNVTIE